MLGIEAEKLEHNIAVRYEYDGDDDELVLSVEHESPEIMGVNGEMELLGFDPADFSIMGPDEPIALEKLDRVSVSKAAEIFKPTGTTGQGS